MNESSEQQNLNESIFNLNAENFIKRVQTQFNLHNEFHPPEESDDREMIFQNHQQNQNQSNKRDGGNVKRQTIDDNSDQEMEDNQMDYSQNMDESQTPQGHNIQGRNTEEIKNQQMLDQLNRREDSQFGSKDSNHGEWKKVEIDNKRGSKKHQFEKIQGQAQDRQFSQSYNKNKSYTNQNQRSQYAKKEFQNKNSQPRKFENQTASHRSVLDLSKSQIHPNHQQQQHPKSKFVAKENSLQKLKSLFPKADQETLKLVYESLEGDYEKSLQACKEMFPDQYQPDKDMEYNDNQQNIHQQSQASKITNEDIDLKSDGVFQNYQKNQVKSKNQIDQDLEDHIQKTKKITSKEQQYNPKGDVIQTGNRYQPQRYNDQQDYPSKSFNQNQRNSRQYKQKETSNFTQSSLPVEKVSKYPLYNPKNQIQQQNQESLNNMNNLGYQNSSVQPIENLDYFKIQSNIINSSQNVKPSNNILEQDDSSNQSISQNFSYLSKETCSVKLYEELEMNLLNEFEKSVLERSNSVRSNSDYENEFTISKLNTKEYMKLKQETIGDANKDYSTGLNDSSLNMSRTPSHNDKYRNQNDLRELQVAFPYIDSEIVEDGEFLNFYLSYFLQLKYRQCLIPLFIVFLTFMNKEEAYDALSRLEDKVAMQNEEMIDENLKEFLDQNQKEIEEIREEERRKKQNMFNLDDDEIQQEEEKGNYSTTQKKLKQLLFGENIDDPSEDYKNRRMREEKEELIKQNIIIFDASSEADIQEQQIIQSEIATNLIDGISGKMKSYIQSYYYEGEMMGVKQLNGGRSVIQYTGLRKDDQDLFCIFLENLVGEMDEQIKQLEQNLSAQYNIKDQQDRQKLINDLYLNFPQLPKKIIQNASYVIKNPYILNTLLYNAFPEENQQQPMNQSINQSQSQQQKVRLPPLEVNKKSMFRQEFFTQNLVKEHSRRRGPRVPTEDIQSLYNQQRTHLHNLRMQIKSRQQMIFAAQKNNDREILEEAIYELQEFQKEYEKQYFLTQLKIFTLINSDFDLKDQRMDLHGLQLKEALMIVRQRLQQIQKDLSTGAVQCNVDQNNHILQVVCGRGSHSHGKAVLKFEIPQLIKDMNYSYYNDIQNGVMLIRMQKNVLSQ
eukprot:403339060